MSDSISRQETIDILKAIKHGLWEIDIPSPGNVPEYVEHHKQIKDMMEVVDGWIKKVVELPSAQPEQQHGRIFQEIVVEYPSVSTYPEYEGKPYFSIKYMEDGHGFIGYGTYKPEVLSEYLIKYFMPSVQPERKKDIIQNFHDYQVEWLKSHNDIELETDTENLIIHLLHDTANRYMIEMDMRGEENER